MVTDTIRVEQHATRVQLLKLLQLGAFLSMDVSKIQLSPSLSGDRLDIRPDGQRVHDAADGGGGRLDHGLNGGGGDLTCGGGGLEPGGGGGGEGEQGRAARTRRPRVPGQSTIIISKIQIGALRKI